MNKQLVLTLLLCATVLAQFNNCPSFYGGDLLQSGTLYSIQERIQS